jgi:multidrug transporter EmrE-like cation transporter
VGAAIFFTLCNASISEITNSVGPLCIFYFAPGTIITSLIYFTLKGIQSQRAGGSFWTNQNLIIRGELKKSNAWGYTAFAFCYFCIQNLAFVTLFFANKANINVGLITTIWSVNPLFMAIMDSIMFHQKLQYYHHIGMVAIVACTVVLSLSGVVSPKEPSDSSLFNMEVAEILPTWVPVIFGVITPMSFTANGMIVKTLTKPEVGFNPSVLSYSAYLVVNLVVLIGAIIYWTMWTFDSYLFLVGLIGSMINTVGIAFI